VCEGNSVSAIDLAGRKRLWSQELPNCACLARAGRRWCVRGGKVVALDAQKGDKLWEADLPTLAIRPANLPFPPALRGWAWWRMPPACTWSWRSDDDLRPQEGETTTAKLDLSVLPSEGGDATTSSPPPMQNALPGMGVAVASSGSSGMSRWTASDGTLFVGNGNGLFSFGGKSGQRLWALPLKQRITVTSVVERRDLLRHGPVRRARCGRQRAAAGPARPARDETADRGARHHDAAKEAASRRNWWSDITPVAPETRPP